MGYQLVSIPLPRHGDYVWCHPWGYRTYAPWLGDEFQRLHKRYENRTVCKPDRCFILKQLLEQARQLEGDVAECGCYRGGTAYLLGHCLRNTDKRLHLFDTFEGMPDEAGKDPSGHKKGDFGDTSLEEVALFLSEFDMVDFHPGHIPDTFRELGERQYCFVHIDVDLYQSVLDCCEYFYDRVVPGGVLLFDDYGFDIYREAAKKAVDEFFADKPEVPICLRSAQAIVYRMDPQTIQAIRRPSGQRTHPTLREQ